MPANIADLANRTVRNIRRSIALLEDLQAVRQSAIEVRRQAMVVCRFSALERRRRAMLASRRGTLRSSGS